MANDTDGGDGPEGAAGGGLRDRLLWTDPKSFERVFAVVTLGIVIGMFVLSFSYDADARLFPIVIAVPVVALLAFLLVLYRSETLSEYVPGDNSSGLGDLRDELTVDEPGEEQSISTLRTNAFGLVTWVVGLLVIIFLFGHGVGMPVFLVLMYRYYADVSWRKSVVFAAVIGGSILLFFSEVLNAFLYNGIVFRALGISFF